jgi:two-component system chemotaxis response regulator CheY
MGKIFSVDDSTLIRNIVRRVAEVLGCDFMEAPNGRVALEILECDCSDIDIILLDVNMPDMDGFTLLDRLKADDRFRAIPVMMVTTESERVKIVRAIKAGATNYLCKPFTQEDLVTKIAESLGHGLG